VDLDSMLKGLDNIKVDSLSEPEMPEAAETSSDYPAEQQGVNEESYDASQEAEPDADLSEEENNNGIEDDALIFSNNFAKGVEEDTEPDQAEEKVQESELQPDFDLFAQHNNSEVAPSDIQTSTKTINSFRDGGYVMMDAEHVATDETAAITEGMVVSGDIQTTGSLDLVGKVVGNVTCYGKLNVTGEIEGNSNASEVFAEAARINGDIHSQGSVKVGQSSVIIGNVFATSAVIAGAVKGDIDVHGPVVLDTTAIVMGNIKSQSVQINNGAVIEGMCSQAYADVNPSEFFEGLKNK
jgi:cytoskeletal protein CcmA (bactofilin family)